MVRRRTLVRRLALLSCCAPALLLVATFEPGAAAGADAPPSSGAPAAFDAAQAVAQAEARLVERHGHQHRARIHRGLQQAAALWRPQDGTVDEFVAFAEEHLLVDPEAIAATFQHFEYALEMVDGHFVSMGRELRHYMDEEVGPIRPVDRLMGAYDPSAHVTDDLFANKMAFVPLLNFPVTTLQQRLEDGAGWSRQQWAEARLTGRFLTRVPAAAQQAVSAATAEADAYVSGYNILMHHLLTRDGQRLFPEGLRLITHWGLRDELKAHYADQDGKGVARQRMIQQVMEAIVLQTIPRAVIDNPNLDWIPATGAVRVSPVKDLPAPPGATTAADPSREPDTRYAELLNVFHAMQQVDAATPQLPTHIDRTFDRAMEMPRERVEGMLQEVFDAPVAKQVAGLIGKRLGRKLEPFDIWYAGFKPRARYSESELDDITRRRYPTAEAFQQDLPRILHELGFAPEQVQLITTHVTVDPSRGAGHALGAGRRDDQAHLRTRVGAGGMDYKGYNIAIHEFGHNVEQVFSLNAVDHTLLAGVPANAFTEALAFVFQGRDLQLLGLAAPDEASHHAQALEDYWAACEISAVALVDIGVWRTMYDHPQATPAQLREATVQIAREVWNRTFGPLIGVKDSPLLAIYSHILEYPLYLPAYPLGHFIAFQLEEHFQGADLAAEFERVCRQGQLAPDVWMQGAVGAPVSPKPLIAAAQRAVAALR